VAAAEMAVVLPTLLFMVLATIDFGRAFYYSAVLYNCARNGAMYASAPGSQSQSPYANVTAAAQADASWLNPLPTVDDPLYCATAGGSYNTTVPITNGFVQVRVNMTFTTIINYPGIPHTTSFSRAVRMRMIAS
jgi:Flp pilus assembly protein TadG